MGLPNGWILIQLALIYLFYQLSDVWGSPRMAALYSAVFVGSFHCAGQWPAATAVAPDLRLWALFLWVVTATAQAAMAALSAWFVGRAPTSNLYRLAGLFPALWVLREWGASMVEVPVSWLAIGYSQAPSGVFAAALPLGGVFFAGWVMLVVSGLWVLGLRKPGRRPWLVLTSATVGVVLFALGAGNIDWTTPSATISVELVQSGPTAVPGAEASQLQQALAFHADTIRHSTAQLVVSSQLAVAKTPEALPQGFLGRLNAHLQEAGADALIGMHFSSGVPNAYYNGVLAIGSSGVQRHLKHHLFPFGEYLPFGDVVNAWINSRLAQPRADAARGALEQPPLNAAGLRLAVGICYEATFGETMRRRATTADILVNVASDGAHASDQLARQFKLVDQARALELQKPVLRTSDVQGTFFLDANGQVSGELPAHLRGVSRQPVQGRTGLTPYARWGDALMLALLASAIGLSLLSAFAHTVLRVIPRERVADAAVGSCAAGDPCTRAPGATHRRLARQSGQVLPVALALLVIVAGFFYLMVNAGQTVTEKMRVTNAADAAAYSAAVVEARALNYDAYLNRAMVANQMAIAQMVSFASWINYFAKASDNFGSYAADLNFFLLPNPDVAVLDVAFAGSAVVAAYFGGSTVQEYADYLIDYGAGPIITAHDFATQAMALSQRLVQANLTAGIRQGQVARQVVKAMDPRLDAEVVLISHGFDNFTKNYSGNERSRFADVAVRSRDPFTRERNFTIGSFNIPLLRKNGELKKRGGTDLIGLDEWRGVDTLELHGQRFGCGKFGLSWCDDIKTPIGWGGIEVDAGGGDAGAGYHGNAYAENATTASKADSVMRSPDYGYFSGIPTSQEIKDVDPASDNTTGITIRVSKSHTDTLTSANAASAAPSGRLAIFGDHPAGGKIAALSRAQVFFDRIAARADGKSELGSLYNPYWRVRLVAPTAADRAYAATQQGGLGLP
jgi:apolipoprotein N-acyltransferase